MHRTEQPLPAPTTEEIERELLNAVMRHRRQRRRAAERAAAKGVPPKPLLPVGRRSVKLLSGRMRKAPSPRMIGRGLRRGRSCRANAKLPAIRDGSSGRSWAWRHRWSGMLPSQPN